MHDLRFHYLVDDLLVRNVVDLGGTPRRIRLEGPRISFVADVRVNGVSVDLIVVDNTERITVTVPARFADLPVTDLQPQVFGRALTGRSEARVVLDYGRQFERVSGFQLLVQLVLRKLLITQGTNRDAPGEGGSLFAMAGALYTPKTLPRFQALLTDFAVRTEADIIAMQAREPRYSAEERMRSFRMNLLARDVPVGTLPLAFSLQSQAGQQLQTPLVV